MRMDMLGNACPFPVPIDNLLHAPRREWAEALRFEKMAILGISFQMTLEHQTGALREENVPIFVPLPLVDENLALIEIHIRDLDADHLTDPNCGVEKQFQHNLVLNVTAVLNHAKKPLQHSLR